MSAIIFTRHMLTPEQAEQIHDPWRDPRAGDTILTDAECAAIVAGWLDTCDDSAFQVYGVFPPILRAWLHENDARDGGNVCVETWEAHNINRAPEGEKPQFEFRGWLLTGQYFVNPEWDLR